MGKKAAQQNRLVAAWANCVRGRVGFSRLQYEPAALYDLLAASEMPKEVYDRFSDITPYHKFVNIAKREGWRDVLIFLNIYKTLWRDYCYRLDSAGAIHTVMSWNGYFHDAVSYAIRAWNNFEAGGVDNRAKELTRAAFGYTMCSIRECVRKSQWVELPGRCAIHVDVRWGLYGGVDEWSDYPDDYVWFSGDDTDRFLENSYPGASIRLLSQYDTTLLVLHPDGRFSDRRLIRRRLRKTYSIEALQTSTIKYSCYYAISDFLEEMRVTGVFKDLAAYSNNPVLDESDIVDELVAGVCQ